MAAWHRGIVAVWALGQGKKALEHLDLYYVPARPTPCSPLFLSPPSFHEVQAGQAQTRGASKALDLLKYKAL